MKRLLLTLLAAIALPTAVNAQTWHLLIKGSKGSMVTVPTSSREECEQSGQKAIKGREWKGGAIVVFSYNCIKGK